MNSRAFIGAAVAMGPWAPRQPPRRAPALCLHLGHKHNAPGHRYRLGMPHQHWQVPGADAANNRPPRGALAAAACVSWAAKAAPAGGVAGSLRQAGEMPQRRPAAPWLVPIRSYKGRFTH